MRPKLLKSFIVVTLFWFFITTLYWSIQRPDENIKALNALKGLLPFINVDIPTGNAVLLPLLVQLKVLWFWSVPVLVLTALSCAIGYGIVWLYARKTANQRTARETGSGEYRGMTLTRGVLPLPATLPKVEDISLGSEDDRIAALAPFELAVLEDIIGTIMAAPEDAYAGQGISVPLLTHVLSLVDTALYRSKHPGLAALVAAGYELAKLTVYEKSDKGWSLKKGKKHERESARILTSMQSWYQMPSLERDAVLMAIKFNNAPKFIPDLNGDPKVYQLAREILQEADSVQVAAVAEQKQQTLQRIEQQQVEETGETLQDIIFDAFMRGLPSLSFQNRGLPKGVQAIAWKVGSRVFLLEIKLRETIMAKLPDDVRGALTATPKEKNQRTQPFTAELLKALEARGWLVRKINDTTVEMKDALWNVKAGKLEFKGVIVIDVPAEFKTQLPTDDSMYEITVTGPLFNAGGGGHNHSAASATMGSSMSSISREELLGSVLRPSSNKPKPDSAPSSGKDPV